MKTSIYRTLRDIPQLNYLTHKVLFSLEKYNLFCKLYEYYIRHQISLQKNYPSELVFMVTDRCNSSCIMCPSKTFREGNVLPLPIHKKIVREADGERIKAVIFTGGEPLMDPTIFEKIQVTSEALPQAKLFFFTNGSLLHKKDNIHNLLTTGLDSITVSLDAVTAEEYNKVRLNMSFKQLIENIHALYEAKKEINADTLIRLSVLALKANERSHNDFFNEMKNCSDTMEINNPHNFAGLVDPEVKNAYQIHRRFACKYLWQRLTIPANGIVSVCGYDFLGNHITGDLSKQTICEVWNHPDFKKTREHHFAREFENVAMCSNCTAHQLWWKSYIV